nr:MAG TPA: hypothetical protein [Caudoviricetes sp.]
MRLLLFFIFLFYKSLLKVNVQPHVSGLQFVFLSRILYYRKLGLCDKCVGSVHIEKQLIESKHREFIQ